MPRLKLTERSLGRIRAPDPSGRQVIYWDEDTRGFGVLASGKTNTRSYIAQRTLPNGRDRRVTVAAVGELPLAEARQCATDLLVDMRRGLDPKAARRGAATLRQILDSYLEARKALRPRTVGFYREAVHKHLADWLDLPLRDITPDMVEQKHRDVGKHAGKVAANSAMRTLRALWNHAATRDPALPTNPVRRLQRQWFPAPRRIRYVKAEQLPAFFAAVNALPNPIHRDYLLLLLFTGLRRREAASLTWEDVDLHQRVIRLPASRTKANRALDLPMSDPVFAIFMERQRLGRAPHVFPSNSKSGHIAEPKFPLKLVAKETGIQVSVHDLRRTFITVAEFVDISPLAMKALVNHSIGGDVTSGYVIMTTERLRAPAQRVADEILKLCGAAPETPANVRKIRRG